jgi:hypothetical protein
MQHPIPTFARLGSIGLCCLLLAACDGSSEPTPRNNVEADSAVVSATDDVSEGPQGGRSGITAIDAALDDAVSMPADSHGPTAYDLARASDRQSAARDDEPAADGASGGESASEASSANDDASTGSSGTLSNMM